MLHNLRDRIDDSLRHNFVYFIVEIKQAKLEIWTYYIDQLLNIHFLIWQIPVFFFQASLIAVKQITLGYFT